MTVMKFANAVVKYRTPILITVLVLMIPALLGMIGTRINYDMLDYLPSDMETVIGQEELLNEFGKGAFSLIVTEDMPEKDIADTPMEVKQVLTGYGRADKTSRSRRYSALL